MPTFSGGLRFAATPGYFLATLRVANPKGEGEIEIIADGDNNCGFQCRLSFMCCT